MAKDNLPQTIFLSEYQPSAFLIDRTELNVDLFEDHTLVSGKLDIRRNPDANAAKDKSLSLDAEAMKVLSVSIDGKKLKEGKHFHHEGDHLQIDNVPDQFSLETLVEIHPEENTSLMGLYKSRAMFCTQCEAEGFRKITPYIDRPDVLSKFTTTVIADKEKYPVLLSNGNPVETRDTEDGRHLVTWEDPFRKPAYLFALVAGDLERVEDSFTTMSGREIDLKIFVEEKDLDKCDHAMRSLKAAMKWDEETYGREYDLDIFMIVAVDDFNMGAMENKGLNIFNTSAVLANRKTTTDMRFQWVEGVVAHEYFHNWSGNRVTCRDWFQLSLKEGFTVFRDNEFSSDMNSRTVKRIENVRMLKAHQFAEDAGPLAHPVQPESYMEINNFYTLTVYEKGAEVVRMQANLLGPELFRKGTDLYFERHDGQAVTIEDFVACMEEVSGMDLTQFKRWYKQAGTPVLEVESSYDADNREYILSFTQSCPPTPESKEKKPFVIPVRMGLLGRDGELELNCPQAKLKGEKEAVLQVKSGSQAFVFENIESEPVPSLLRSFSAPVKLRYNYTREELATLVANDTDGFNRWDAMQRLAIDEIQRLQTEGLNPASEDLMDLLHELMNDPEIDKAMLALMLVLPSIEYLAELEDQIDLDSLWQAREHLRLEIAKRLQTDFRRLYKENEIAEEYQPSADQIARRSLKNIALNYWLLSGDSEALVACNAQFDQADNMTDQSSALTSLVNADSPEANSKAEVALSMFYNQWQDEPLVVNQWFAIQAGSSKPAGLARVKALMEHPAFSLKNPNKARSVIGAFCSLNPHNFHSPDGAGYEFIADQVIALNAINPQIASRLVNPLTKWKKMDENRAAHMRAQLQRIAATENLSSDVREVVSKSL
jgi:aminopeptidase N